jgi:hypothetical protein
MTARLGTVALALMLPLAASAGARDDVALIERAAKISPQAQYDAARDVEERSCGALKRFAHGHVLQAEGIDRLEPARAKRGRRLADTARSKVTQHCDPQSSGGFLISGQARLPRAPSVQDVALSRRLEAVADQFDGISAVWTHDLVRGTWAGWNADARFPAASTVKLALLVAAYEMFDVGSEYDYDIHATARWSSNLGANRILSAIGTAAANRALRKLGATHSAFTGPYRVGTSRRNQPPAISGRVTTARDLGAILYSLANRAARGDFVGVLILDDLAKSEPFRDNVGILRPRDRAAQKHGWFSVVRHSAAIVYTKHGPRIVVLLTYAPGLTLARAQRYGAQVMKTLGLATRGSP